MSKPVVAICSSCNQEVFADQLDDEHLELHQHFITDTNNKVSGLAICKGWYSTVGHTVVGR